MTQLPGPHEGTVADISRRRFVQGVAVLGGTVGMGASSRTARALAGPTEPAMLSGTEFDLTVSRISINKTGTPNWANAINGSVPGPTLRFREGNTVTLRVTNHLPEMTGIHWHGLILPNVMDGVPGLAFPGIKPGETYTYRFPVVQSGTYWYHSHMGYQEQKGSYGAIIIDPREGGSRGQSQPASAFIQADRDYVVMLNDWTDETPYLIQNKLKYSSNYYNFHLRTVPTFLADVAKSGFGPTVKERAMWDSMNMTPTDIIEPTGRTYTFTVNGLTPAQNWTALFRPGERVRLRFINGSAMTYYDVRIPGLAMSVVQADGNDVVPVEVDEFRIGTAETYDVIVQPRADAAYTILAQAMDRSGYARATLAPREGMQAAIPPLDPLPMRTMTDMGMPMMSPADVAVANPDLTRVGGIKPSMAMPGMKMGDTGTAYPGEKMHLPDPHKPKVGVSVQTVAKMPTERLGLPGDGLNQFKDRRVLTYADLRSVHPSVDTREPSREIVLHLTGNMERYIWGFDGKRFTEAEPIVVKLGERWRFRLINDTMMAHPIHLHGMWSELENGHGEHRPYKHTISVQPGEELTYLVTALDRGQWAYHCHLLYHFEAGMFRTVKVV